MKFCNFLLRVDGIREASLEDMKDVVAKGNHIFRPQKQKYLYSVDMDINMKMFDVNDNKIYIKYVIADTECEYELLIEMGDIL